MYNVRMRGVLVCVIVGMLASTAAADPFEVRNPVPDAPPSATPFAAKTTEILDPGHSQRRIGTWVAVGGGVFVAAGLVLSRQMAHRYKAAVERIDAGRDVASATADANAAAETAKLWGTGLFVTGTVAVATGLCLYLRAPAKIRREQVVVAPIVERDGGGFAISGGF
jgi:hypothetical protein